MIEIKDLEVNVEGTPILKKLNLLIAPGEIHAIMGPNGAGKSTLAKVIAGHPAYEVTGGEICFEGESILPLSPEERARKGLFLSFQYPPEIGGVTNFQFLFHALNARRQTPLSEEAFELLLDQKMNQVKIPASFKKRNLNEGFSGGEKKRNEILQMAVLEPKCSVLDETDSGLDIDAMRIVAEGINQWMDPSKSLLLITHYQRLLDYVKPHFVHVLAGGKIIRSGDHSLALELEAQGYADVV